MGHHRGVPVHQQHHEPKCQERAAHRRRFEAKTRDPLLDERAQLIVSGSILNHSDGGSGERIAWERHTGPVAGLSAVVVLCYHRAMGHSDRRIDDDDSLRIGDHSFRSRLFVGTGKYKDVDETRRALEGLGYVDVEAPVPQVEPTADEDGS